MTMSMTCGAPVTVNEVAEVAVPPGVVTLILPVVAPAGTDAVIWESSVTVKVGWAVVLNVTALAPVNPVPVIVTGVPTDPLVGLKLETVGTGGAVTLYDVDEVATPPGVVTVMVPLVAPVGTVAVMWESFVNEKVADTVWNATAVTPVNPDPLITTEVPTGPLVGLKLAIAGFTVNVPDEVAVPPGVVTVILPVVAPPGTFVVIWVSLFTV
jgi:hypothetical protein